MVSHYEVLIIDIHFIKHKIVIFTNKSWATHSLVKQSEWIKNAPKLEQIPIPPNIY